MSLSAVKEEDISYASTVRSLSDVYMTHVSQGRMHESPIRCDECELCMEAPGL